MRNRSFKVTRTLRLFLLALVAALLIPAAASAADKVSNPGTFTLQITGGALALQDFAVPIDEIEPAPTLTGTIDADGNITIPESGVNFPPLKFDLDGDNIDVFVRSAGPDWVGTIDPETGAMDLEARLRIKAEGSPAGISLGSGCWVGAAGTGNNLHLNPATTGTIPANGAMPSMTGTPYNPETLEVTVVNNTVSVPGANGCGPLNLADGPVNDALGLPSASGNNSMSLEMNFIDEGPLPPGIVKYTATPDEGYVPLEVEFDASDSIAYVNNGEIDAYKWDFDGDGVVDETTTDPTVSHTYTAASVNQTALTIVMDDVELTKQVRTVTARSIEVNYLETPPAFSQSGDADFEFEANEPGATFECMLLREGDAVALADPNGAIVDPAEWEACDSPVNFTGLDDADWTMRVRATSAQGATGLSNDWNFRVDNVGPTISITQAPSGQVNYTSAAIQFQADEGNVAFECRIIQDADPDPAWDACESGDNFTWDAVEGDVTFEVTGTDFAGNPGNTAATTWEYDETAPTAEISWAGTNPTNKVGGAYSEGCDGISILGFCLGVTKERSTTGDTSQSFSFGTDPAETGVTYQCQFNDGSVRPCISGVQTGTGHSGANNSFSYDSDLLRLGDLNQGDNTLKVWATDTAGNTQAEPTVFVLKYDTQPPVLTAISKPAMFTKSINNAVVFEANEEVASFECRTVNNTGGTTTGFANNVTGYGPCTPGTLSPTMGWASFNGQTDGLKGVQVRATDLAGNAMGTTALVNSNGVTAYWVVDNTAPTATFANGTINEGSFTLSTDATINVGATDAPINFGSTGTSNNISPAQQPAYECSLNNAAWDDCDASEELSGLTAGPQSFRVRVTDEAGNVSPIIERKWTVVDGTNASVTITDRPDPVVGVNHGEFEFTPDGGTAECRLDATAAQQQNDSGWQACSSPVDFTGLADGSHQIEIRAAAGTVPAIEYLAVYTAVPTVNIDARPGIGRADGVWYTGIGDDSFDIKFSAADNPAYAPGATTFECRYYEQGQLAGPWEDCSSPYPVMWDDSTNGTEMVFEVRPISSTGNMGADKAAPWTVDLSVPTVALGDNGNVTTACGNGAANGPGPAGCVATANSTQPGARSQVTTPRFQATSSAPVPGALAFACQLNDGPVENPCVARTSAGAINAGNPLTVSLGGSRGNNDNLGHAINQNAVNTIKIWAVSPGGNLSADAAEYTWRHTNAVPTFAVPASVPEWTNEGTVDDPFTVDIEASTDMWAGDGGAENGFLCRPQRTTSTNPTTGNQGTNPRSPGGSWQYCSEFVDATHGKWIADDLTEGRYVLEVRGFSDVWVGNTTSTSSSSRPNVADWNANGKRFFFTVDRTAPVPNITGGPAEGAVTAAKSGAFTFTVPNPNVASSAASPIASVECRIDPLVGTDNWTDCANLDYQFSNLNDGVHLFQVRATDEAGNQGQPVSRNWTVDSTVPEINLSSNLAGGLTSQTAVEFTFSAEPVDSDLECRIDAPGDWPDPNDPAPAVGENWAPCASPLEVEGLTDGQYTFHVKAINTLGAEATDQRSWTVDTVAPSLTIDSGPSGASASTTATFEFSSDDPNAAYECQLDAGGWAGCASPETYTGLADGSHTFEVRAADAAGNQSGVEQRTWTIDTVNPVAEITDGPTGFVESDTATFEFDSNKPGSTFECQLDSGAWQACTSPATYSDLANGVHTFRVRASDGIGNTGPAADQSWAVDVAPVPDEYDLTVSLAGDGAGAVTSVPNGIDCGNDCTATFEDGTRVTLTATPDANSEFAGWSGAVDSTATSVDVYLTEARNVTATFTVKEEPPVEECGDGEIGTWPDCKTPAQPPLKQPVGMQGAYNPATGKLSIKTKCPPRFQKCNKAVLFAVTGQGKKAKFMSKKAVVKNNKGGKAKTVVLTIKPKFRAQVEAMTTVNAKRLFIRIKATGKLKKGKKKGKRVTQQFHHKYKVRVKG